MIAVAAFFTGLLAGIALEWWTTKAMEDHTTDEDDFL